MYVHTCISTYIYIYVYIHICINVHTYYMYVYTFMIMRTYINVHIFIYVLALVFASLFTAVIVLCNYVLCKCCVITAIYTRLLYVYIYNTTICIQHYHSLV